MPPCTVYIEMQKIFFSLKGEVHINSNNPEWHYVHGYLGYLNSIGVGEYDITEDLKDWEKNSPYPEIFRMGIEDAKFDFKQCEESK